MPRWMTTSVTPLFSLAFFLDVSLKWPSSRTSPWRDENLTIVELEPLTTMLFRTSSHWLSIAHLALALLVAGKFTYLNYFNVFERKWSWRWFGVCWILPGPRLASVVVGLEVGSGWRQVWTLDDELDCLRVVGLVLGPHKDVAGANLLLTAGDGTQCRLSLTAWWTSPNIAREIPGKRNHARNKTKAQVGMIYLQNGNMKLTWCV